MDQPKTGVPRHISKAVESLQAKLEQRKERSLTTVELTARDRVYDFDWQFRPFGDITDTMLKEASNYAIDMDSGHDPYWLSFCGPTGTGKTHLAKALYRYWKQYCEWTTHPVNPQLPMHQTCWFTSWHKVVKRAREESEWSRISDLADFDFLVLDDIAKEHSPSGWSKAELFSLLDRRREKWTVITCNLTPAEIGQRMDPALEDRLFRNRSAVVEVPSGTPSFSRR